MIAGLFLFALVSLGIPIAIALWNRKRHKKEAFGAYYLLKKVAEVRKRRIQLLEILKLLNRLALFTFLILVFAEPVQIKEIFQEAGEGFAVVIDTSRVMQAESDDGESLIDLQIEKLREVLGKIPSESRGAVFLMADRCDALRLSGGVTTATPEEWLKEIEPTNIPYGNQNLSTASISRCEANIRSLFGDKKILQILISSLPLSLDIEDLRRGTFRVEALPPPASSDLSPLQLRQEAYAAGVSLIFGGSEEGEREMFLLQPPNDRLPLGDLRPRADLPVNSESWLWIQAKDPHDPWRANQILNLENQRNYQVVAWTQKESLGYQSLLAALRSHPQVKVIRQLGERPIGENVIIYGNYSQDLESFERAWFFTPINGATPFELRDQKTWTSTAQAQDLRRSFEIDTSVGDIFIRRYNLFQLGRFDVLETFKDGAPSLLSFEETTKKIWVSPFDLEDLTTDLTLEPNFIPYLYDHLESWLGDAGDSTEDQVQFENLWAMPGRFSPTKEVLEDMNWPGIYKSSNSSRVVEPVSMPEAFHSQDFDVQMVEASLISREESLRDLFIRLLLVSFFLELILCLSSSFFGRRAFVLFLCLAPVGLQAQSPGGELEQVLRNRMNRFFALDEGTSNRQQIEIAYYAGMQSQRKEALEQFVKSARTKSNLDFADPVEAKIADFWRYSCVIFSMTDSFPEWTELQREKIRDYLERGGLLIFDDPTAVSSSSFYRWASTQMSKILPGREFKSVEKENVLFRTYYLLEEVSGRRLTSPHLQGVSLDNRWVAVFSTNDLLGANYRLASGDFGFSVSPYGNVQRVLAERLFLNLSMYSVAIDYKNDAIHLPHILKRRVR